jgi:hypothetical protein
MILIDQAAGTTRTPDAAFSIREGRPTVIVLERDGTLHHYPPDRLLQGFQQARIDIHEDQVEPGVLDRILTFTFDVLGLSNLEVRVHEQPKR